MGVAKSAHVQHSSENQQQPVPGAEQ